MVKEEIIEGLRTAIAKGEPLEKAMMSFYNAGYKKEEIEAAAAAMVQMPSFVQPTSQPQPTYQPQQFQQKKIIPQQTPTRGQPKPLIPPPPASTQDVSDYGKKPSEKGLVITVLLVALLLLLLGGLIGLILFKQELSDFFNSLFWRALF